MSGAGRPAPVVLCILDGFGISDETRGNAIAHADMPRYRALLERYPHTALGAAQESVGLPHGQQGNSEVGHLNLGAGRVVLQSVTRIDRSIDEGTFTTNPTLQQCFAHVRRTGGTLHLLGLVSDGGVHSSIQHLFAIIDGAKALGVAVVRGAAWLADRPHHPGEAAASGIHRSGNGVGERAPEAAAAG